MENSDAAVQFVSIRAHRTLASARKSLLLGLSAFLYSHRRKSWVFLELVIAFCLFIIGVQLSPYVKNWSIAPSTIFCSAIYAVSFSAIGLGVGFYDRKRRFSWWYVLSAGFLLSILATLCALAGVYLLFYVGFGRLTFFYGAFAAYFAISLLRLSSIAFLRSSAFKFTTIGTSPVCDAIQEYFSRSVRNHDYYQFVKVSAVDDDLDLLELSRKLQEIGIADIVLANSAHNDPRLLEIATFAMQGGCRVIDEISFYSQVFERIPVDSVTRYWVLSRALNSRRVVSFAFKRLVDVVVSVLGLIFLSPFLLMIAIAIRIESKGPALFFQSRTGLFCKPFSLVKFRTMKADSDAKWDRSTEGFTKVGDSRVTRIGRILRPLHLDELPQLWNILRGEMSLIGPRPEATHFARKMMKELPLYDLRYLFRPGLSGLAQISMGYAMDTVEDTKKKLSYDLHYICNFSPLTDLRIMIRTCFVLMRRSR